MQNTPFKCGEGLTALICNSGVLTHICTLQFSQVFSLACAEGFEESVNRLRSCWAWRWRGGGAFIQYFVAIRQCKVNSSTCFGPLGDPLADLRNRVHVLPMEAEVWIIGEQLLVYCVLVEFERVRYNKVSPCNLLADEEFAAIRLRLGRNFFEFVQERWEMSPEQLQSLFFTFHGVGFDFVAFPIWWFKI